MTLRERETRWAGEKKYDAGDRGDMKYEEYVGTGKRDPKGNTYKREKHT